MLNNGAMVDAGDAERKRRELRAFIDAKGLKVKPWAAKAHVSSGTVRNFLSGLSQTLTQATVDALADAAQASPNEMFPSSYVRNSTKPQSERVPVDNNQSMVGSANQSGLAFSSGAQTLHSWPKDLKIVGHVKAGVDGVFLDQGEIHGMAYRPPALSGVKDAFAVYVHDDSMFPAFEPGYVAWVHPHRPVKPGDNVVVELKDGLALIKRLVRRTEKQVICQQWRPEKEVRYESAKVKRLYYVVGSYKED